jgi:dihydroorotase
MSSGTRREFLGCVASLAVASTYGALVPLPSLAAMGPNDKFDLVVKGGEVLDPSQNLRARRDVGVRFGLVEAVEADIPATRAHRVLNADGKVVVPGLIDLHAHVFPYGSPIVIRHRARAGQSAGRPPR